MFFLNIEAMNKAKIDDVMTSNITDLDIKRYFPETNTPHDNLMKYSELADVQSLDEILPHDKSFKIILIEDHYNIGHFVCILRYGNTYEQFDSYGKKIDDELAFISNIQKKLLGQDKKYLTHLFAKLPRGTKKVINKKRLQNLSNNSATCGRWCILRISMMQDFGFGLKSFQEFITRWKSKLELSGDEMVSLWVR
jgi:hypothetical protein